MSDGLINTTCRFFVKYCSLAQAGRGGRKKEAKQAKGKGVRKERQAGAGRGTAR